MNKFTFSYFETFLQDIHLDQYSKGDADNLVHEFDDVLIVGIEKFLSLIKMKLQNNRLLPLTRKYQSEKSNSLGPNDKLIFDIYSFDWLRKLKVLN